MTNTCAPGWSESGRVAAPAYVPWALESPFMMICGVEWTSTVTAVPGSPATALTVTWVPATVVFVVASI